MSRAPERGGPEPKRFVAALRALLLGLVPGRAARTAEFDAAARMAYEASQKLEAGVPLEPALPGHRATASPLEPARPGPRATVAPSAPEPVPLVGTAQETATPSTELAFDAHAPVSAPAAPPHLPEPPVAPVAQPADALPGSRRRRQPGETAPDFLLRTPTGVAPIADDFFDSLIRRVEGDR